MPPMEPCPQCLAEGNARRLRAAVSVCAMAAMAMSGVACVSCLYAQSAAETSAHAELAELLAAQRVACVSAVGGVLLALMVVGMHLASQLIAWRASRPGPVRAGLDAPYRDDATRAACPRHPPQT
jgi:hypothetical protein